MPNILSESLSASEYLRMHVIGDDSDDNNLLLTDTRNYLLSWAGDHKSHSVLRTKPGINGSNFSPQ